MSQNSEWSAPAAIWSTRTSLARMDNKWTTLVVITLGRCGVLRFGDLRVLAEGISAKVLTGTLRDLERDGLVARHAYAELPPRVVYELTELGCALREPMRELGDREERRAEEVLAAYDVARIVLPLFVYFAAMWVGRSDSATALSQHCPSRPADSRTPASPAAGLCLDDWEWNTAQGVEMRWCACNNNAVQRWRFA